MIGGQVPIGRALRTRIAVPERRKLSGLMHAFHAAPMLHNLACKRPSATPGAFMPCAPNFKHIPSVHTPADACPPPCNCCRRKQLLAARDARQKELDAGKLPDFLPETKAVSDRTACRVDCLIDVCWTVKCC